MAVSGAYIGGVQAKDQLTHLIKTNPKVPKANGKMTVRITFENKGVEEGSIGKVALWLTRVADHRPSEAGGYFEGARCAYEGYDFWADFSDVVLKPGQSRMVKLTNVPVPATAGWWQLSALPDINCKLAASRDVRPSAPYVAVEVVD
ncbi:hypothetical protein Rsub_11599 [Raphidocelis subcapitata]|uniref:Uncharacterized protein n=1 Tax=Raphidocelis subcapitata TaxID=307507 RepID=A0A2V0PG61_9CHLO|nr:hypothetical protein Rsub_11599 [Raphidocelis subcapitata]|eukprot:GBF98834.1 hypothetical protein Rsub_11599 [Raphidocelis subcapitata]